jgi:hypothetical protein
MKKQVRHMTLSAFCAVMVVACGGSSSSDALVVGQAAVVPDASVVNTIPAEILRQIPASTYALGTEERLVHLFLNAERIRCGFGPLRQDALLDAAASAHAKWGVLNQQLTHTESFSTHPNGFTGATLIQRAQYQGYQSQTLGEVLSGFTNMPANASEGIASMRMLLNAPYHMVPMTGPFRDMGVSIKRISDVGKTAGFDLVMTEFGVKQEDTYQDLPAEGVFSYPCEGSTGVAYSLSNEDPNPVPGRNLATDPLGTSIIFRVRRGQALSIDAISVVETASGTAVKLRPLVGANGAADVHAIFDGSVAYVAADQAMKPNTRYTVNAKGSNDGTPFTQQFNFSTGDIFLPSF